MSTSWLSSHSAHLKYFFFLAISHLLTVVFRGEKIHLYGGETSLSRIKTDLGLEFKIILSAGVEFKSTKQLE